MVSFHRGAEANDRNKIDGNGDLPLSQVLDVTRDAWNEESAKVEDWEENKPGEVLDQTIGLATVYHQELAPTVRPIAAERQFIIEDESWDLPLLGYIDVEEESRIIDRKTAGKSWSQGDVDSALQGSIYLLARHLENKPEAMDYHIAVKLKTPKVQELKRERIDHLHTVVYVERVQQAILSAVSTGLFAPCSPGAWNCSPKWCGFHTICPFGQ